jgi:hypothetical protein
MNTIERASSLTDSKTNRPPRKTTGLNLRPHHHQLVRLRIWQWRQQSRITHREDCVLAPVPSASVNNTVAVRPGLRPNARRLKQGLHGWLLFTSDGARLRKLPVGTKTNWGTRAPRKSAKHLICACRLAQMRPIPCERIRCYPASCSIPANGRPAALLDESRYATAVDQGVCEVISTISPVMSESMRFRTAATTLVTGMESGKRDGQMALTRTE